MHKIGFNLDLLAQGMERGGGGAQRRFAVLDIQTLITGGFVCRRWRTAWMRRSGMSRLVASATAHFAALMAASEPSTPTTIRPTDCGWFLASSDRSWTGGDTQCSIGDVIGCCRQCSRAVRPRFAAMVTCGSVFLRA